MSETAPAGWYPDPEDSTKQRYWDGAAWTQNVAATSSAGDAPQAPGSTAQAEGGASTEADVDDFLIADSTAQPIWGAPVLQTWKTSVGFSVLGLLLAPPLLTIVAILPMMLFAMRTGASSPQSFSPILVLVGNALMLVYALKFYPSYFSEKPRLRSSKLISFANLMFGGLIFGSLWNGNLTKKTKGSSYIVQAVLSGLMCLQFGAGILFALFFGGISNSTSTPSNPTYVPRPPVVATPAVPAPAETRTVEPLERTKGARIYTDKEAGASFVIPSTWTEIPLSKARVFLDAKFRASGAAQVLYGSVDAWSTLTEQDRQGQTRADFDSMDDLAAAFVPGIVGYSGPDGAVELIKLNGVEYYALSFPASGNGLEMHCTTVLRLEKGRLYQFQYWTPAETTGGSEDAGLQTFYSTVASMVYPKG